MALSLVFFYISLSGIFLSEVFNYNSRLQLNFYLLILAPFILFMLLKMEKKRINIPIRETIVYFIFLIFSAVSTYFAVDKEIAVQALLTYASGFFFFIFSFNYYNDLKKHLKIFLVIISVFSCLIFLTNNIFHLDLFKKGISLFYSYGHNQIGNLLVIGLLSIFPNPLSLFFFIFILFSFSRTAYISLILVFMIQFFKKKLTKKVIYLGALLVFVSLIFTLLKTSQQYQTDKKLMSGRDIYFSYAISSIKELPLFGIGPGNFSYAVFKRQVNEGEFTDSAENIILEVLSENGLLAGAFFILFVLLIFYNHKKDNNFYMFLALSLMFMTDFSYNFNFFLMLWFILGGLTLESSKNLEVTLLFPALAVFIAAQIILFSQILLKQGLWKESLMLYPLQKNSYKVAISENIRHGNMPQVDYYLKKYDQLFGRSTATFQMLNYYRALKEKNRIVEMYERILWFRPYANVKMMRETWYSYIDLYGNAKANEKIGKILRQIKSTYSEKDEKSDFYRRIDSFCTEINISC